MFYPRSFSAWCFYMGGASMFISIYDFFVILGPSTMERLYFTGGLLMILLGSLSMYLKYRKNSKCPICRVHLKGSVKYVCPHCNNTLK